ncbi:BTAD domain-containing putative transcriptional regulator [Streptomyces sp. NPDC015220]|uniref:AfsR/SARP family transcriptional regulator n=1 Tax=Streptomyces sp. NPDC015220 TaxID=3364947 RepID=UPI0036F51D0E
MPIRIGGPRQKVVLATLLLGSNRVVTVDRLVESSWWKEPPPSAAVNIRGHVAGLRKMLRKAGESVDRLSTHSGGYVLEVAPGELDLHLFMNELQSGSDAMRGGEPERAAGHFVRALQVWKGNPLEGMAVGPALQGELERLEELRLLVIEHCAQVRLEMGQSDALVPELRSLTRQHPFRERLWEMLIIALHRMGRQADALAAYTRVRRTLADELGIDPSDRLRYLEEQILRGDPDMRVPAVAAQPLVCFPQSS